MSVESVDQLPDDVLVMVLQYLDEEDLLTCRLSCKRLADLALHPDVWRRRRIRNLKACLCAVLHLAPCLDKVPYDNKLLHTLAFPASTCAVAELEMTVYDHGLGAAVVIRHQQALGRLKRLRLHFERPVTPADMLLRTLLAATSDLDSLTLTGAVPDVSHPILQGPYKSSLRYFKCNCSDKPLPRFVTAVLAGHAATLEEVKLGDNVTSTASSDTTALLLAGMPRLRSLRCAVLPGADAAVIRHLQALGRLSHLHLDFNEQMGRADVLVKTLLAATTALESLVVTGGVPEATYSAQQGPCRSSLKYFSCDYSNFNPSSPPFVTAVLSGHAATLEEVDLGEGANCAESLTTARLLAGMPRLRSLTCVVLPGMEAVASSATLTDVYLYTYASPAHDIEVAADFLRRACLLRKVFLDSAHHDGNDGEDAFGAVLIQALALSGRSRLEWLTVCHYCDPPPTQALVRALPCLPALRRLEVTNAPLEDALLLGITPATAPALRRLVLSTEIGGETEECVHGWMHRGSIKTALTVNPALHIQLEAHDPTDYELHLERCKCADLDCHQNVEWESVVSLGLFSHDVDSCPSPEDHTNEPDLVFTWFQIRRGSD